MKYKKNSYGSVITNKFKDSTSCQVQFFNPLTKEVELMGTFKTEKEAFDRLHRANFDFFDTYSNLLPRCISLNRRDKSFNFSVTIKGKTVNISSSKDLDKVCEDKFDFITSLIS